jgi:short-subunit dehydrogenase
MSESDPVILVTGASSGIGLCLARQLSVSPYRAVITARQRSLQKLPDSGIHETSRILIRPLDVTREEERRSVIGEVQERWGGVDILINNAGISYRSVIEHMTDEDEHLQMATNYFGPLGMIRLCLPHMREQRFGRIINVSSVGGMMAMPTMGSYSASKFALEGASEALWYELRPWNIDVCLVQPGFIRSNSFEHVYLTEQGKAALRGENKYQPYYTGMGNFVGRLMRKAFATPESIADKIINLIPQKNPPLRIPSTPDAWFFSLLRRLLPRKVYHRILFANLPDIKKWGT